MKHVLLLTPTCVLVPLLNELASACVKCACQLSYNGVNCAVLNCQVFGT